MDRIRSRNPHGFGGVIVSASAIDEQGEVRTHENVYSVRLPYRIADASTVQPGQRWLIHGNIQLQTRGQGNDVSTEWDVQADSAELCKPCGKQVIDLIERSPDFCGIGRIKALKLWSRFGEELYRLLDDGDAEGLTEVLTLEVANVAIAAWAKFCQIRTIQVLRRFEISEEVCANVTRYYGREIEKKMADDPYRLLSFAANWNKVDQLAPPVSG